MKPLRILLADDHALVRAGIRLLLERMPHIEVVGEADDGLETAARAAREFPQVKVIILSMHAHEEYVMKALRAGAAGYLLKDSATTELELALLAAQRGEIYLSPAISRTVIDAYMARVSGGAEKPPDPLTPRQLEILRLVAEGQSTKEIAFALNVSVKTVETHRAQLMQRLGIHEVTGLVKYAMRLGLIPPPQSP